MRVCESANNAQEAGVIFLSFFFLYIANMKVLLYGFLQDIFRLI